MGLLALSMPAAQAQLNIAGTAAGTFAGANTAGLTYTGATFSVFTVNGQASLGSVNTASGGSIGTVTLSALPGPLLNGTFNLTLDFTAPGGASPDPLMGVATVSGQVVNDNTGGRSSTSSTPRFS